MPQPKHITFFLPNLGGGGAERVMLNLAKNIQKRGCKVDFFLVHKEGVYLKDVPENIRVLSFGGLVGKRFKMPQSVIPLARYLRKENPDILISAMNPGNLVAIVAKIISMRKIKVVVTEHNTLSLEIQSMSLAMKKTLPSLMKLFYPKADFVIATTKEMANDLSSTAGISRKTIDIIYNPVFEPRILEKAKIKVSHPFFQEKSEGVLINVGNLNQQKNHTLLIKTLSILRKTRDVRLIILGEGEKREKLEKMIDELNLRKFISMPGFVENPYSFMAQSDIFVFSSLWEGLPTVLIEALACGTPIVSADCPTGPTEVLKNGEYGKLVPVDDAPALAKAIEETLDNPPDPQKLRERAEYFSVEKAANQYLELLFNGS